MKPDQIFQGLKDLADKIGIFVSEQRLSAERFKAKSGLCKIKGRYVMLLDKQLSVYKKNIILADCLNELPHDAIFVVPAVRDFLNRHKNPMSAGTGLTEGNRTAENRTE
jgi:hypothetical protein